MKLKLDCSLVKVGSQVEIGLLFRTRDKVISCPKSLSGIESQVRIECRITSLEFQIKPEAQLSSLKSRVRGEVESRVLVRVRFQVRIKIETQNLKFYNSIQNQIKSEIRTQGSN